MWTVSPALKKKSASSDFGSGVVRILDIERLLETGRLLEARIITVIGPLMIVLLDTSFLTQTWFSFVTRRCEVSKYFDKVDLCTGSAFLLLVSTFLRVY